MRIKESRDTGTVYAMDRICFPSDDPVSLHSSKWWVAQVDGTTAGYAGAKVLLGAGAVYLSRAGVMPAYRGRGVQLSLIRRRVAWARTLEGVDRVITDTSLDNLASANNLIRAGFFLYDPEETWRGDQGLYWMRMLD